MTSATTMTTAAAAATSTDVAQLQQTMVDVLVDRYDLTVHAQEVNRDVWRLSNRALSELKPVATALEKMQRYCEAVVGAGARWRAERQQLNSAMLQHSKLLALTDAPALLAECMQQEMYAEAMQILQRLQLLTATAPTRTRRRTAHERYIDDGDGDDTEESTQAEHSHRSRAAAASASAAAVMERVRGATHAVLERGVDELVRVRLTRALTVDAAFRMVHFLHRLGTAPRTLRRLFLQRRRVYVRALYDAADAATSLAYARALRYVSAYKMHVSDVVLQYHACFSSGTDDGGDVLLACWCRAEAEVFVRRVRDAVAAVTSAAELATIAEQCGGCVAPAATAHMDVSAQLSDVLVARMHALVDEQLHHATRTYRTCMMAHSWKGQQAATTTTTMTATSDAATATAGTAATSDDIDHMAAAAAVPPPPLALTQQLPLAYALNGVLTCCNAVRKCMLPSVDVHLGSAVAELVQCIASDVQRDAALCASMDAAERDAWRHFVRAFVDQFVPHVLRCTRVLVSAPVQRLTHERIRASIEPLAQLC